MTSIEERIEMQLNRLDEPGLSREDIVVIKDKIEFLKTLLPKLVQQ